MEVQGRGEVWECWGRRRRRERLPSGWDGLGKESWAHVAVSGTKGFHLPPATAKSTGLTDCLLSALFDR